MIVRLYVFDAVFRTEEPSVAVTVTEKTPAVVGVPLKTPALFSVNPPGSPAALHTYGSVPPVAVKTCLYEAPTVPFGSEEVEITKELLGIWLPSVILSNPIPFATPPKFTDFAVPLKETPLVLQQL